VPLWHVFVTLCRRITNTTERNQTKSENTKLNDDTSRVNNDNHSELQVAENQLDMVTIQRFDSKIELHVQSRQYIIPHWVLSAYN
jgi:hypothetical protein